MNNITVIRFFAILPSIILNFDLQQRSLTNQMVWFHCGAHVGQPCESFCCSHMLLQPLCHLTLVSGGGSMLLVLIVWDKTYLLLMISCSFSTPTIVLMETIS